MNGIITKFTEHFEQQAVEYTDLLFYLARKSESTAEERCARVEALTEAYFEHTGGYWPDRYRVLDRLATLILHKELSDRHPDKMTREEFPIMSDRQEERLFEKMRLHAAIEYRGRETNGRRATHFTDDAGSPRVGKSRLPMPYDDFFEHVDSAMDLQDVMNTARLTDRQRQAVELVYFEDKTQEEAGRTLGLSRNSIDTHLRAALDKLRKTLGNS